MRCFIGLGSNQGISRDNLEKAAQSVKNLPGVSGLAASPVFVAPALLPEGAPSAWNIPYHNAVLQLDWQGSAQDLLAALNHIERQMGRMAAARWAPRIIDLDILLFGDESIQTPGLQIPHAGLRQRSFVLDPLLHLAPGLIVPQTADSLLRQARSLSGHAPLWMGILNLTPDSFSDGGSLDTTEKLLTRLDAYDAAGVQILDLGAESTRPGALPLTAEAEWARLEPALLLLEKRYKNHIFRPLISVDTYRAAVAARALELGADIVNDVSGLADSAMPALLRKYPAAQYVLMHSLSVPASRNLVLDAADDPVILLHEWAEDRLSRLQNHGIAPERIIFDPGIGFGKTAQQSLTLLQNIAAFMDLPCRLMVGHSRKSFMTLWSDRDAAARDDDSIGVSLNLARSGVDILRVHVADRHAQAWTAFQQAKASHA